MKKYFNLIVVIVICLNHFSVSAQYCTPSGAFSACALGLNDFWITDVSFTGTGSTFSYSGGACVSNSPYYLNTGYQGDVVEGNTYTLNITKAGNTYKTYFNVWVDWDNNNVLSDATPFVENIAPNLLLTAGGGVTSTASITIPIGVSAGVHRMRIRVQYNVTNSNNPCLTTGQAETKDFNLNVIPNCVPPSVVAGVSNANICEGDAIVFTGSGALTYQWNNGVVDGTPFFPTATNTYTVTGTDAGGCTASDTISVVVNPQPSFTISISDDSSCIGESVEIILAGAGGLIYNYPNPFTVNPVSTTTYYIIATDQSGCSKSDSAIVVVLPLPIANTGADTFVCDGDTVTLTGTGGAIVSFLWSNGSTGNSISVSQSGDYSLTVTDMNGCTALDSVKVGDCNSVVTTNLNDEVSFFPNPFADFISVQKLKGENEIELINVQGKILFRLISRNENEQFNTSNLASGIYLLRIKSSSSVMNKVVVKN